MPEGRLAHTRRAEEALIREARRLLKEGTVDSLEEGLRVACTTLDGAADIVGGTVESVQTCVDLLGHEVPGLTSTDTARGREDPLAGSETARGQRAEAGSDANERWLREHDPDYKKTRRAWRG